MLERLRARIQQQESTQQSTTFAPLVRKPETLAVPADRNGEVWVTDGRAGPDAPPDPSEAGSLRASGVMLSSWENRESMYDIAYGSRVPQAGIGARSGHCCDHDYSHEGESIESQALNSDLLYMAYVDSS